MPTRKELEIFIMIDNDNKNTSSLRTFNETVDYLNSLGIDPYPFDSVGKKPTNVVNEDKLSLLPDDGEKLKHLTLSQTEIEHWKRTKEYEKNGGIAFLPGEIRRGEIKGQYCTVIDCDGRDIKDDIVYGLKEQFSPYGIVYDLEHWSNNFYIEYHEDDPNRFHIIFISPVKFPTQDSTNKKQKKNYDGTIVPTNEPMNLEVYCDNNHWMITAPSKHTDGYNYNPMGRNTITGVDERIALSFLEMLKKIYKKYGLDYGEEKEELTTISNNNGIVKPIAESKIIDTGLVNLVVKKIKPYYKEGLRDQIIFGLSGFLRKSTITLNNAKQIIEKLCEQTDDEEESSRMTVLRRTYAETKSNDKIVGYSELEKLISKEDLNEIDSYIVKNYEHILISKSNKKRQEKLNKESAIIEWLLSEHHLLTLRDSEELLFYEDGVYLRGGEKLVSEIIEQEYTHEYQTYEIKEFINKIKRRTYVDRTEFDKELIFCFNNGLVDLQKPSEIKTHDPSYYCLIKIPHIYDPNASAPKFDKFLDEVLKYSSHKDLLLESMGYSFYRERPFDICTILTGNGDNGKSVVTEIWSEILGEDRVSYVPLKDLTNNRFALSQLVGKYLNIDPEMPKDTIVDSSMIKRLNSIHKVQVEEKFKASYPARLYAKFVFNANKIPRTYDNSRGFYKRIRIIPFPYNYVFKPANELKGNERIANPDMINELKGEIPGIINLCFKALRKLLTEKPRIDVDAQREMYEILSNPLGRFVDEQIEIWNSQMVSYEPLGESGSGKIAENIGYKDCLLPKEKGYEFFKKWCGEKDVPVVEDYNSFCRIINDRFKDLEYFGNKQKTIDSKPRTWCWYGIRLKPEDVQQPDIEVEEEELERVDDDFEEYRCLACGRSCLLQQKETHEKYDCYPKTKKS